MSVIIKVLKFFFILIRLILATISSYFIYLGLSLIFIDFFLKEHQKNKLGNFYDTNEYYYIIYGLIIVSIALFVFIIALFPFIKKVINHYLFRTR